MILRLFARVHVRITIVQALSRGPSQTDTTQMSHQLDTLWKGL